jgi:hypothetical protein
VHAARQAFADPPAWMPAMRINSLALVAFIVTWLSAAPLSAQLNSPQIGWLATLSKLAHNVSGTVTIVDDDTLRVDDFTYDGGGLSVYFYLGAEETKAAFTAGLQIGPQLLGQRYVGGEPPLFLDLPAGETIDGWRAVTVWCVDAAVSFGQGTFAPVIAPGDFNADGVVDGHDFLAWQRGQSPQPLSAPNLNDWRTSFPAASFAAAIQPTPEPAGALIALIAAGVLLVGGRKAPTLSGKA